jgi:hypothetical protein
MTTQATIKLFNDFASYILIARNKDFLLVKRRTFDTLPQILLVRLTSVPTSELITNHVQIVE